MDADGSHLVRLTNDAGEDRLPAWSPDGKRIAFASDRTGNADLYIMDADGQNLTQLTSGLERDGHPAWSPDGAWLAFNSGRGSRVHGRSRLFRSPVGHVRG
ncbi:MAG: PD40 domain-containing protein [Anaerolineae bacterium]|nr:MAG: PD40 domain-containing protein [Anaerolineae bacterium]